MIDPGKSLYFIRGEGGLMSLFKGGTMLPLIDEGMLSLIVGGECCFSLMKERCYTSSGKGEGMVP